MPEVDILLRAQDQATATINKVSQSLTGLDATAGKAASPSGGVGGLGGVLGSLGGSLGKVALGAIATAAALVPLAITAGKTFAELGQMGEASAQAGARFDVIAGGSRKAGEALAAFDATLGNAMNQDEKLAAATRILSLELANTGAEAAEIAEIAITLGDSTQSATSRIDAFTQMLVTGQTRGLAQFGISAKTVKDRIEELTAANGDLTAQEAGQIAIMEVARGRMGDFAAAGFDAVDSTTRLGNAVADLKGKLSTLVAPTYKVFIQAVTSVVEGVSNALPTPEVTGGTGQEQALRAQSQAAKEYEAALLSLSLAQGSAGRTGSIALAQAFADDKKAALDAASAAVTLADRTQAVADKMGSALQATLDLNRATQNAAGIASAATTVWNDYAAALMGTAGAAQAATDLAQTFRAGRARVAADQPFEIPGRTAPIPGADVVMGNTIWDQYAADAQAKIAAANAKAASAATSAWNKAASAVEAAWNKVTGSVKSKIEAAAEASRKLTPGGGENDIWKPGGNGPLENLFRVKDVAVHGAASPWASVLKMSQEAAAQISKDFENLNITPDVAKFIDKDAFVKAVHDSQVGSATLDAFVADIAKAAGTGTAPVMAMLGLAGDTSGKATSGVADITTGIQPEIDKIKGVFSTAFEAVTKYLSEIDFKSIGEGMVQRLIDGIEAKADALKKAMEAAAAAAANVILPPLPAGAVAGGGAAFAGPPAFAATPAAAGAGARTSIYNGGDSYSVVVMDQAAAALLLATMDSNRRQRLNRSMGA